MKKLIETTDDLMLREVVFIGELEAYQSSCTYVHRTCMFEEFRTNIVPEI